MADTAHVAAEAAAGDSAKNPAVERTNAASEQIATPSNTQEAKHATETEATNLHVPGTVVPEKSETSNQQATMPNAIDTSTLVTAPTSAMVPEATSVKKEEAAVKIPDPPVPEPPQSSNKASASDPAISVPPVASSKTVPAPTAEAVPDPDEDDLDDLDELLDEFSTTKLDDHEPVPSASGPGRPGESVTATTTSTERDATGATSGNNAYPNLPFDPHAPMPLEDDEFARQLNAGMSDLLGELESSPEMQRQFEQMLRELGSASAVPDATGAGAAAAAAGAEAGGATGTNLPPMSFQESIQRTMERMQESSDTAGAAAANASQSETDFMASLLREMESGGSGTEEDFSKMLLGMMEQLTNKDILYDPMKELDQKFPEWMIKNKDTVSADDLKRYEEQQKIVREIVAKFEEPGYTDDNVESRQFIVDRMQKMQAAGSPPSDLVGDMDAAQEALGDLDAGCPTQ